MAGLVFSVYLSMDAFVDWRQNMIITRFENSELPVTELDFPAVTICSQGIYFHQQGFVICDVDI